MNALFHGGERGEMVERPPVLQSMLQESSFQHFAVSEVVLVSSGARILHRAGYGVREDQHHILDRLRKKMAYRPTEGGR